MRFKRLPSQTFINNRKNLTKLLKPNSVVILNTNDLMPRSADSFHIYRPDPDMYYLTGIDQEDTFLILYPDAPNPEWREILFVKETNEHIAIWEGEKFSKDKASDLSGIEHIQWSNGFWNFVNLVAKQADCIYLNTNEHDRFTSDAEYAALRLAKQIKTQYPTAEIERLAPHLHSLRAVKQQSEIDTIRHACTITRDGFNRLLKVTKPGVMEYELEAELLHEFVSKGSRGFAYEPIIASGANACVLHYNSNHNPCKDGELILLDVGAEYAHYASDLSRTIPVNGVFSKRQKQVYNAVIRVMQEAKLLLTPGNNLPDYHKAVGEIMTKELVDLGLLSLDDIKYQNESYPAYKKYFMHGTSHHLGIDVHDSGNRYAPFREGNVFTVEPGIYIREEGIGIRLENDVVITNDGILDLMIDIPIEAEEIEDLMNS